MTGKTAGRCTKHDDLAWLYDDDSIGCMGALIIETGSWDCKWEPMPVDWTAPAPAHPEGEA